MKEDVKGVVAAAECIVPVLEGKLNDATAYFGRKSGDDGACAIGKPGHDVVSLRLMLGNLRERLKRDGRPLQRVRAGDAAKDESIGGDTVGLPKGGGDFRGVGIEGVWIHHIGDEHAQGRGGEWGRPALPAPHRPAGLQEVNVGKIVALPVVHLPEGGGLEHRDVVREPSLKALYSSGFERADRPLAMEVDHRRSPRYCLFCGLDLLFLLAAGKELDPAVTQNFSTWAAAPKSEYSDLVTGPSIAQAVVLSGTLTPSSAEVVDDREDTHGGRLEVGFAEPLTVAHPVDAEEKDF
jgi:hypothetical protein